MLSLDSQPQSTGVAMKTHSVLLFEFAVLIFSGCSSQFLLEYVNTPSTDTQIDPQWYNDPWFHTPPEYVPPVENATSENNVVPAPRSGGSLRRTSANLAPQNARSTGAVRTGNSGGVQNTTQTTSSAAVPTRGDTGNRTGSPQNNSQSNQTPNRGGRR